MTEPNFRRMQAEKMESGNDTAARQNMKIWWTSSIVNAVELKFKESKMDKQSCAEKE